ncbi:Pyridine nucleotide-disulfide oxidoreductase, dimerization domain [Elasticomyces elasticus]|uniref:Pyridine nucleotide-disulfide oxidoreductase, dimerization domain n=1 Tax=Elasticomyces elasticus TaxID=574655 RepID=A0AAN7ZNX2_9PEZI|nr:Pyridine nucleotide-disulfide oxidoreductase, dimerization domain [Elasticomyces elasticus]
MSQTRPDIGAHPKHRRIGNLTQHKWDVVILGGGPTGQTAAVRIAGAGLSVLLVERELAGGECQNWACVPSKALLRPLEIASDARAVGGIQEALATKHGKGKSDVIDLQGLWGFRDRATFNWNDTGNSEMLERLGVVVVHGSGSLQSAQKVVIRDWYSDESVDIEAKSVVIATGSESKIPPVNGLTDAKFWTPREAVSAREVPPHLVIFGAGPVGSEFATIYSQLGSRVTLVTTGAQILPGMVSRAAKTVHDSLVKMGVEIRVDAHATEVQRREGKVIIGFSDGSKLEGSEILIATGRKTRTTGIGLTAFSIQEAVPVAVDQHMRAKDIAGGWLYAIGDTNGIGNTTHMGMYEATICAQHIIGKSGKTIVPGTDSALPQLRDTVPQTCFTEPQVSWVGQSLAQATGKGIEAKEISVETGGPGTHSYLYAENYTGWAQWVIEVKTGKLLGAVFVGKGVANLLHASTVAIVGGMTWQQMLHAVPSFPTLSEAYNLLVQQSLSTEW